MFNQSQLFSDNISVKSNSSDLSVRTNETRSGNNNNNRNFANRSYPRCSLSNRKVSNRSVHKLQRFSPYLLRSTKLKNVPHAVQSTSTTMDASHPFLESVNHVSEHSSHERVSLADSGLVSVPAAAGSPLESHLLPSNAVLTAPHSESASNQCTVDTLTLATSKFPAVSHKRVTDIHTVMIDGKTYESTELIAVITRLKHDVRICTERIVWLENELLRAKSALSARDRDVHKLKSVLDQKVPTTSMIGGMSHVHAGSPTNTEAEGVDMISAQVPPPKEMLRIKKLGVSGESHDEHRTWGLVHHRKDSRSSQLIRDAIENNDFLRHLDKSQVEEIVKCMYKKLIPQGSHVIREGQTGDALYVVAEGVLEVTKDDQLLGRMDVGRAFGELALLYNCNRTASVRALTKASAWTLDRRIFQTIMMSSCLLQHEENFQFLSSVPALKRLPPATMHKLADVLETVYHGPDEYIIREGEIGDTFFIIKSGKVRVTKMINDMEDTQEIRQLGEGDWFGEKALYTSDKRSANVIAMESGVQLLSLDRSNFIHLIGDLSEIKSKDYGEDEARLAARTMHDISSQNASFEIPSSAVMATDDSQFFERAKPLRKEDFETIAVIGTGGFGCVELVRWDRDQTKSFALKRMKKQHIVQTRQQEHICSERQIMLQLCCPFICRLYCTFKDTKFVYMVMEVCLGGEIWTVLRNCGRFNDVVTRFTVACVLEAFTYLHTQGIIYRDLKPENLLLDERGYVKLCDFGFAKRIGLGKKTWTFCGTPEYVAPEIILNKGHDYSADYWSLGILIYELLTGSPPFTGSDPMKIYNVVLRGIDSIEFPALYISKTATILIKRLCAQNPTQRLGYGIGGVIEIKQNKYFQGFDWIGLHRRTLVPPIQPKVSGPLDASNFDKYPQKLEIPPDEMSGWDAEF